MNQAESAFELSYDGDHLGDDETDASLIKFEGYELIAGFIDNRPKQLPERIYFEGNLETLKTIDFPINDQAWPIMSARMRVALRSVGDFPYREIPVVMLDDTVDDKFDSAGNPRPGVAIESFAAVQITEYTDAFDWERSEYVPHKRLQGRIQRAKKLVLKDVPLPPLFRLSAFPGPLLVSAASRTALERANVQGAKFIPLDMVV